MTEALRNISTRMETLKWNSPKMKTIQGKRSDDDERGNSRLHPNLCVEISGEIVEQRKTEVQIDCGGI